VSLPFSIKQDALQPVLAFSFRNGDGTPLDLTGYTVTVQIVPIQGGAPTVNDGACVLDTPNTLGTGHYPFAGTDTAVAGRYLYEFTASKAGVPLGLPTDGQNFMVIAPTLG